MGILIQNGTVVSARSSERLDVLMDGEQIREVAPRIAPAGHTLVDATGLLVMPGGIDVHTHLDMPFGGTTSADDYTTGTQAAAVGGTTTVIDFALQSQGHTMREALDTWPRKVGWESLRGLLASHGHHRSRPRRRSGGSSRNGRDGGRGHHQLQTLHGLSGRV